jgi:type IV pilus assembly protein PilA
MNKKERGFTLVEVMIVVALIGILFAITLPQYQNYKTRGKVAEALVFSTSVQRALISYYYDKGMWPLSNGEASLPEKDNLSSTYLKRIEVFGISRWRTTTGVC